MTSNKRGIVVRKREPDERRSLGRTRDDARFTVPAPVAELPADYAAWKDPEIVQQVAAQIPWFHNCLLLDKVKDQATREWYIHKTVENGWSRRSGVRC